MEQPFKAQGDQTLLINMVNFAKKSRLFCSQGAIKELTLTAFATPALEYLRLFVCVWCELPATYSVEVGAS